MSPSEALQQELRRVATESVALCRVRSEEKVVVYMDTGSDQAIAEAWYAACAAAGCDVSLVRASSRPDETDAPAAAIAAMVEADVVFDVASNDQGYAPSMQRIMGSGTRMLQILMPADVVARRAPTRPGRGAPTFRRTFCVPRARSA